MGRNVDRETVGDIGNDGSTEESTDRGGGARRGDRIDSNQKSKAAESAVEMKTFSNDPSSSSRNCSEGKGATGKDQKGKDPKGKDPKGEDAKGGLQRKRNPKRGQRQGSKRK